MTLINTEKPHALEYGRPTSAAMREIAAAMEALHQRGVELDMRSAKWSNIYPCDTPCCHAGAFALAVGWTNIHLTGEEGRGRAITGHSYISAAAGLAEHLGFSSPPYGVAGTPADEQYTEWARSNPDIWGNNCGGLMFDEDIAFIMPHGLGGEKVTLDTISRHYRGVADRLEVLEALDAKRAKALAENA